MRLGQAKREFNVETTKIVQFFGKQGIEISEHPNSKLTEEQVTMLQEAFPKPEPTPAETTPVPEQKEGEIASEETINDTPQEEVTLSPVMNSAAETLDEVAAEEESEPSTPSEPQVGEIIEVKRDAAPFKPKKAKEIDGKRIFTALDDEDEEAAKAEVIRAPKQELQGLRVVGKVELPEPSEREKKKRIPKAKEEASTKKVPLPEVPEEMAHLHPGKKVKIKAQEVVKEEEPQKQKSKGKKRKKKKEKSISERLAEKKKHEEKKKKRKNPHRRLHKSGEQVQRIKVLDDGTIVPRESKKAKEKKPKEGLWKRFWRWFNT